MKKTRIIFSLGLLILSLNAMAQVPLRKGNMQLNAGLGISGWGIPIYGGLEFGFMKDITLGGEISFRSYTDRFGNSDYRHSIFGFNFFGNYHFNDILEIQSKKFDVYAGAGLGYYIWNSSGSYKGSGGSGIGLGLQIGGRYFFNNQLGFNLELGGNSATSGGKIGITYVY